MVEASQTSSNPRLAAGSVEQIGVRVVKRMSPEAEPFPQELAQPDESAEALDTDEQLDRYEGPTEDATSRGRHVAADSRGGPQPGGSSKPDERSR
jgi:hypothetical protein